MSEFARQWKSWSVPVFFRHPVLAEVIKLRSRLEIKLPDAIIAASALIESLPLMTAIPTISG